MSATNRGRKREPLDAYYTSDALAQALVDTMEIEPHHVVLDPCVGGGAFARAMRPYTPRVYGIDLHPRAAALQDRSLEGVACQNFLAEYPVTWERPDLIMSNPPFFEAEEFVHHALKIVKPNGRVAFLLRVGFLEGIGRYYSLWQRTPPSTITVLVERPSFTSDKKTDASAYMLAVWTQGALAITTELRWLSWRAEKKTGKTLLEVLAD